LDNYLEFLHPRIANMSLQFLQYKYIQSMSKFTS